MSRILIVEDEKKIARFLELELTHEGYEVDTAYDGRTGLEKALSWQPDLMILDLMLPELSGIEVCRRLRHESDLPIIMLTAKDDVSDKVMGLDMGADDYMTKPFAIEELLARIRALLRRTESAPAEYRMGELYLCPEKHIVRLKGEDVSLTQKEFQMLCLLTENRGVVYSRAQLIDRIWGYDFDGETRTVDVHIRTLRQKLGPCGSYIETVRGFGYKIGETL